MDFSFTRDGNNPQLAVIKLLYGFIVAHSPELTALVFASLPWVETTLSSFVRAPGLGRVIFLISFFYNYNY